MYKSLICCTKCEVKPIFATFYKYCETGCSCKRLMVGSSVGQMGGWSLPHGREVLYLSTRIGVGLGWRGRVDFGDGLRDVYKLGEGRTQWCKSFVWEGTVDALARTALRCTWSTNWCSMATSLMRTFSEKKHFLDPPPSTYPCTAIWQAAISTQR